jgi:hypothetical protein
VFYAKGTSERATDLRLDIQPAPRRSKPLGVSGKILSGGSFGLKGDVEGEPPLGRSCPFREARALIALCEVVRSMKPGVAGSA